MKTRSRFTILLGMLLAGSLLKAEIGYQPLYTLQKNWTLRDSLGFVCVFRIGPYSYVKLMSYKYMTRLMTDGTALTTDINNKLTIKPLGITQAHLSSTLQAIINAPYGVVTTYVPDDTTLEFTGTGLNKRSRIKTGYLPAYMDTTKNLNYRTNGQADSVGWKKRGSFKAMNDIYKSSVRNANFWEQGIEFNEMSEPSFTVIGDVLYMWSDSLDHGKLVYWTCTSSDLKTWEGPHRVSNEGSRLSYTMKANDGYHYCFFVKTVRARADLHCQRSNTPTVDGSWAFINSGNPVYTYSSTPTDWDWEIFNPAVVAVGNTFHMILDGKPNGADYFLTGYSYQTMTNPASFSFMANRSTLAVLGQGCADIDYIPSRNALIYARGAEVNGMGGQWDADIRFGYASLDDDLKLAANWHEAQNFLISNIQLDLADPDFVELPDSYDYRGALIYSFNQATLTLKPLNTGLEGLYDLIHDDHVMNYVGAVSFVPDTAAMLEGLASYHDQMGLRLPIPNNENKAGIEFTQDGEQLSYTKKSSHNILAMLDNESLLRQPYIELNGTNSYFYNNSIPPPGTGDRTISVTFRLNSNAGTAVHTLAGYYNNVTNLNMNMSYQNGYFIFQIGDGVHGNITQYHRFMDTPGEIINFTWVISQTSKWMKIFQNGVELTYYNYSDKTCNSLADASTHWNFGRLNAGTGNYFNGDMFYISMLDTILSDSDARRYSAGKPLPKLYQDNIIVCYPLNQVSGDYVFDTSPNHYDASVLNCTWRNTYSTTYISDQAVQSFGATYIKTGAAFTPDTLMMKAKYVWQKFVGAVLNDAYDTDVSAWWRADMGISLVSGYVSGWADQVSNYTLASGLAAWRPQYVATGTDSALLFDGTNDVQIVSPTTVLDVGTSDFTIDVYLKTPATLSGQKGIIEKRTSTSVPWYLMYLIDNTVYVAVTDNFGTHGQANYSGGTLSTSTTYLITLEWDWSTKTVYAYLDGVLLGSDAEATISGAITNTAANFKVGSNVSGMFFNKNIYEIRWSPILRSPTELILYHTKLEARYGE